VGLIIATVGQRPLGVQVGEVLAVAETFRPEGSEAPVTITAIGPRTSTVALIASALSSEAIDAVTLHEPKASLKYVIESTMIYNESPELFTFGLLKSFDLPQIAELVAPRSITMTDASSEVRSALQPE